MRSIEDYREQLCVRGSMRERVKEDKDRLRYHLMPPSGWMNDPNGLCQFHGLYHIYYQYTPFQTTWGTKIWGHYTTRDWLRFKEEEPFLFPDIRADRDGAYSGSALVEDGEIRFFYTGNVKLWDKPYDYIMNGREQNTIFFTSRDGFHTGEKKVALTNDDYPADMSKHVRDPKIYVRDGKHYMVLGARDRDSRGCALVFSGDGRENWSYSGRFSAKEPFGYLWECPDLFDLEGQTFLAACPQGLPKREHENQNVYQCGYFPAEMDPENGIFRLGTFREFDKGFDFYAAQTFEDEKKRRILIAWMAVPDSPYDDQPTTEYDWIYALTMPRVLSVRDGKLIQQPMEEMKALRRGTRQGSFGEISGWKTDDSVFELNLVLDEEPEAFELMLREDVCLSYENGVFSLSLGACGRGREKRTVKLDALKDLTVFSDTSSIEIFLNGGEQVMTSRIYSQSLSHTFELRAKEVKGRAVMYELAPFEIEAAKIP